MFKLGLNEDHTMYTVLSSTDEVLFTYRYKLQAVDHVAALNLGNDFDPAGKDYKYISNNML
jgi:hypothetical protein